ncbi:hypothetical protein KEM55_008145, partial [Ascosphaera atra]
RNYQPPSVSDVLDESEDARPAGTTSTPTPATSAPAPVPTAETSSSTPFDVGDERRRHMAEQQQMGRHAQRVMDRRAREAEGERGDGERSNAGEATLGESFQEWVSRFGGMDPD